jgi:hypothetical protein
VLRPIFGSHAAHLPGMTRSTDDWIIDTIINPWQHELFSIEDAIVALDDKFEILGSSPRFLTDWRWYKDIHGSDAQLNKLAIRQYHSHGVSLIDCRAEVPPVGQRSALYVAAWSRAIFDLMQEAESGGTVRCEAVAGSCVELADHFWKSSWRTSAALRNAAGYFRNRDPLVDFVSWFGRGQQYISFVRNPEAS